jgi:NAD(P)-dependent dehydrogenase (short-subunit alcohol dehydrogenase family)
MPTTSSDKQLLLIGASRGLGFALAEEYLKRGWHVVATERDSATSRLHDLLRSAHGRLEIATVDITFPDQVAALRALLASRQFDMLFVNAGIGTRTHDGNQCLESHACRREFAGVRVAERHYRHHVLGTRQHHKQ